MNCIATNFLAIPKCLKKSNTRFHQQFSRTRNNGLKNSIYDMPFYKDTQIKQHLIILQKKKLVGISLQEMKPNVIQEYAHIQFYLCYIISVYLWLCKILVGLLLQQI